MSKIKYFLAVTVLLAFSSYIVAQMQTDSKSHPSGKPASITGKEAWDLIEQPALQWQKDVQVFNFRGGSFGPHGSLTEGKGSYWYAEFYSPSDASSIMVSVNHAMVDCNPGRQRAPKLMLNLDESVNLDTTQIYKIAIKAGGKKYESDCIFSMSLDEESGEHFPELKGTHWLVSCSGKDGRTALFVQINARTERVVNPTRK